MLKAMDEISEVRTATSRVMERICEVNGWSYRELSRRLEYDHGTLCQVRRGKRTMPPAQMWRLWQMTVESGVFTECVGSIEIVRRVNGERSPGVSSGRAA